MKTTYYNLLSIKMMGVFFDKISFKKSLSFFYLMIFLNIFISCDMKYNSNDDINASSIISMDSLLNLSQEKREIIEVKLSNDTLLIISTEDALYYPFGKYHSLNDFQLSQPILQDNSYSIDSTEKHFKVITLKSANNFLKLLASEESGNLEIIDAEIKDNDLRFSNDIKIGMSQKEFLSIFFHSVPNELEKVSVIELESGLTGIWHYYSFSKNKLKRISLISDYQIDMTEFLLHQENLLNESIDTITPLD